MTYAPLTPDRAIAAILGDSASHTFAALLPHLEAANLDPEVENGIYRMVDGLQPGVWPHVIIEKTSLGARVSAQKVRFARSRFTIYAAMREDRLTAGTLLSVLDPIATAILNDLQNTPGCDVGGGRMMRPNIETPDYESSRMTGGITFQNLGVVARVISR
jgi:hypothetical protein